MESYRTEEEQVEALKRWWDENGRSTIVGIVLALGAAFGWQAWQHQRAVQSETASDIYQRLLESAAGMRADDEDLSVDRLGEKLKSDFDGTVYAQFAALQMARFAVEAGNLDEAEKQLRWTLDAADSGSDIALVTQQRLARVLAAKGQPDEALDLLKVSGSNPYQASYAMARGDILLSEGRDSDALAAYQLARQLEIENPGQFKLATLEQKIISLGYLTSGDNP